jgi:hypothetical protein
MNNGRNQRREIKIGVVGYCPPTKFNEIVAARMIADGYRKVIKDNPDCDFAVVSGLTNVGVLKIAYAQAKRRGWRTVGVACEQAAEHPLFPVDEKIIVGKRWGEESSTFLSMIDVIVRIGNGQQSVQETECMKVIGKPTYEYKLPALKAQ